MTITVSGNAGLALTSTSTTLTTVDASGITLGDFSWTSGSLASAATVKGSATGTNTITISNGALGPITYVGGSGADTISIRQYANTITVGAGADKVTIRDPAADVNTFSTITDAHSGMAIGFVAHGNEQFEAVAGLPASTLREYADAVIALLPSGASNGQFGWFQFNGDTYIVESQSGAHATFTDGTDFIIKLTGLIDLATATISAHALLLA